MSNYQLKALTKEDRSLILYKFSDCEKDIHKNIDYLRTFEEYTNENALVFLFGNKEEYLLIPYFLRKIDEKYKDIISPWYYGGPVFNTTNHETKKRLKQEFSEKFTKYCKENDIISEFQRLNPLLKNHKFYEDEVDKNLFFDRDIVYCDLTKDHEVINSEYNRSVRKNINKAKRNELEVVNDESKESILQFLKIYQESMQRKAAGKFYFFSEDFFNKLFERLKDKVKLFHVKKGDKVISSTIIVGEGEIAHDYLRGADPNYTLLRPNDLAVDEIIKWAKKEGYKYFSFGGGATNSEDDGILRFKKTFSPTTKKFYIYKKIHNKEVYEKLCKEKNIKDIEFEQANFFPEYRKIKEEDEK